MSDGARIETSTRSPSRRCAGWALLAIALATVVDVAPYWHWITPISGIVLTVGIPAFLLAAKLRLPGSTASHRAVLGVALSILLLILIGLFVNTTLPLIGDHRPLDRLSVATAVLLENLALAFWRPARTPGVPHLPRLGSAHSKWIVALLALSLLGCVAGANRLNNGASGAVTLGAFTVLLVALASTWIWRAQISDGEMAWFLYAAALTLLLATSLRGWYITGHDVQREYHVFQLTNAADRWNISAFQDPDNVCLSLTILPTIWARLLRINDPYIFKVFYQCFFALSATALFLLCRRHFSRTSAFLAVIFYIAFPTFSTDMPFITRQEIGFTFLSVAALVLVNDSWSVAGKRLWFIVFSTAIVLSHYSTTYLLLIALAFSQVIWRGRQLVGWVFARRRRVRPYRPVWGRPVAGVMTLAVVGALAFLWTEPATHTSSQLRLTVTDTIQTLLGRQQAANSSDVSYSFVHSKVLSPAQELAEYRKASLIATKDDPQDYLSRTTVDNYTTPVLKTTDIPLTRLGRELTRLHLTPNMLNATMRSLLAKYYQAGAIFGLFLIGWLYWRARRIAPSQREYACLAAASFVGLAAVVVLPDLSAEYGLLRAFQQALIFVAPLIAETTLALAFLLTRRHGGAIAIAGGLVLFASLSGVIPQAAGGYLAQLNMNNSGTYYNDYYLHSQELDAISWLDTRAHSAVQAEIETDRYTSYLVGDKTAHTTADIFPTLIERHAFVFVGYATVTSDIASVSIDGNTVSYRYPMALLNTTKDLVFSSNGARIYR